MDDLAQKLDQLLGSEEGMKRIEDLMAAFGGMPSATEASAPPLSAPPVPDDPPDTGMPDLQQLMKLLPLLGGLQQQDDSTALLKALRPHLKNDRQKRLDEASQMLRLMRLLPLLKELKGGETLD